MKQQSELTGPLSGEIIEDLLYQCLGVTWIKALEEGWVHSNHDDETFSPGDVPDLLDGPGFEFYARSLRDGIRNVIGNNVRISLNYSERRNQLSVSILLSDQRMATEYGYELTLSDFN